MKIGSRADVAKEFRSYRQIALEHLPYHLGPRLRLERCALGHTKGIIVSDYVSGAEPLRDCARGGRAASALGNLFSITFRPWHNNAEIVDCSLAPILAERLLPTVPDFRLATIKKSGATEPLESLRQILLEAQSRPVSIGVIHGDLHATNVLVRDSDAILIDFEKVEIRGPLLRDYACLEGGLLIDGFVGDTRGPIAIFESLKCLYEIDVLKDYRVDPCHPVDGSAWFFDCIAQIRMHARQVEQAPLQYALVLATEMLRKACNAHDFTEDDAPTHPLHVTREHTRALAYRVAEHILSGVRARHTHAGSK